MIIFDEKKYAEELLKNGYKNIKYITFDNIVLVKYWKSLGLRENDIEDKLRNIMIQFQNLYDSNIMDYKINKALNIGMKYDLLTDKTVEITKTELEHILSLGTLELQKMMFIFILLWKFRDKPKRIRITNTDIMNLSKVKVKNDVFWDLIYKLTQSKMISMVEYKNKSYYKLSLPEVENDEVILMIDKFNNVVDYFLSYIEPEKYINCENCGVPFSPTNNKNKYCLECAREKQLEWQRESMKKIRNKNM